MYFSMPIAQSNLNIAVITLLKLLFVD